MFLLWIFKFDLEIKFIAITITLPQQLRIFFNVPLCRCFVISYFTNAEIFMLIVSCNVSYSHCRRFFFSSFPKFVSFHWKGKNRFESDRRLFACGASGAFAFSRTRARVFSHLLLGGALSFSSAVERKIGQNDVLFPGGKAFSGIHALAMIQSYMWLFLHNCFTFFDIFFEVAKFGKFQSSTSSKKKGKEKEMCKKLIVPIIYWKDFVHLLRKILFYAF